MLASLVVNEIQQAVQALGNQDPYTFALIQGLQCNYLGYAIATTNALAKTVKSYMTKGYRYHGSLRFQDAEAIGSWLKWANPDEGWLYFEFQDQIAIHDFLQKFDGDDDALRTECIKELRKASMENTTAQITLGVTYGQDPADYYHSVLAIYGKQGHKTSLLNSR